MLHREVQGAGCRVQGEALTAETDGPAIEPRNQESRVPMLLSEAEGNSEHGVNRPADCQVFTQSVLSGVFGCA